MSRGGKYSNIDRVIGLFRENGLYAKLNKTAALCIELILKTGATPIDLINIQPKHFNTKKNTLKLHIHKKKRIATTTHTISSEAINTFFELEATKSLSTYSIRRLQQLIKKETEKIGSKYNNPRSLRKEYLKKIFQENPSNLREKTQLISIQPRKTLNKKDQEKLLKNTYSQRNKSLILTLLHTGIRINELLHLQAHHIKKNKLEISKSISHNKQIRTISLPKIELNYPKKGLLFTNNREGSLTQRRFEQICKEVEKELNIKELTPSIIRATAIQNLSKILSEKELLIQSGLQSSTIYTHAIFTLNDNSTSTTTSLNEKTLVERKDSNSSDADEFMYTKSKLKDGGDTDE